MHEHWARQRAGCPASQRADVGAWAIALGDTAVSLLARAAFKMTHAGLIALAGPARQAANMTLLPYNSLVFMQARGQMIEASELEAAGWTSLGRWARRRAGFLAS